MRKTYFRARGVAAGLGLFLGLGAGAAWAESPPCRCRSDNQKVESEVTCLIIDVGDSCSGSSVRSTCDQPVSLVGWPIFNCSTTPCVAELKPGEKLFFGFSDLNGRITGDSFEEETYAVIVDGREVPFTLSADVTCGEDISGSDDSCAAAPGSLAALGLMGLVGTLMRRRRRA